MEENYKLEREYRVSPDMFMNAYRAYQKKFVFPKKYLFIAIFLIIAADFVYAAVKDPSNLFAYFLIVVCIALAFREWHNPHFLRQRLYESIKELGEPLYKIGISDEFIDISTVEEDDDGDENDESEEELSEDDTYEENDDIPPEIDPYPEKTRINIKNGYRLLEYEEFFLIMQGKSLFYILPKEFFSDAELDIVRKTYIN